MATINTNNNLNTYSSPFTIILNPNGDNGETFIVTPDETCTLSIDFDYLFKFDCYNLNQPPNNNLLKSFEYISTSMSINVLSYNNNAVIYNPVYTETVFKSIGAGNAYNYIINLSGNPSGIYFCGSEKIDKKDKKYYPANSNISTFCDSTKQVIFNNLLDESGLSTFTPSIDSTILDGISSEWLHFHTDITDSKIIDLITNKSINISLEISGTVADTYILLDNINISRNCTHVSKNEIFVTQSPGFKLTKTIDNKKSWDLNTSPEERTFGIKNINNSFNSRETDYNVKNGLEVINTKEIDLAINIAKGIETDVWTYVSNNPCILNGTGTTSCYVTTSGDTSINLNKLMTQSLSAVTTVENFEKYIESELIDAKNRKIISYYPTLRLLYDRYKNSNNYCNTNSNAFEYSDLIKFQSLIGGYWSDLIEQVIPATTIWNSTKTYNNTAFDTQKFQYKPNTLFYGTPESTPEVLSPCTGITEDVSIITSVIISGSTNISKFLAPITKNKYTNAYLIQYNSGSEFIGSVNVTANFTCNISLFINNFTAAYPNNTGGSFITNLSSPNNNGIVNYSLSAHTSNSIITSGQNVSVLLTFNNLSADTYTLTVTDIYGCEAQQIIEIWQNPCALTFTSNPVNSFKGMNDGYIDIKNITDNFVANNPNQNIKYTDYTGQATGYTLTSGATIISAGTITNGQTGLVIPNLSAGEYELTITEEYGCTVSSGVTITENPCILSATASSQQFSQFDDGTGKGSISLSVINAYGVSIPAGFPTPNLTYQSPDLGVSYTLSGVTTNTNGTITDTNTKYLTNLSAGTYNVNFIDNSAIGCYTSTTVSIPKITYSGYEGYCEIATADFKLRETVNNLGNPNSSFYIEEVDGKTVNRIYLLFGIGGGTDGTLNATCNSKADDGTSDYHSTYNIYYTDNSTNLSNGTITSNSFSAASKGLKVANTGNGEGYYNTLFDKKNQRIYFVGYQTKTYIKDVNKGGLDIFDMKKNKYYGTINYGNDVKYERTRCEFISISGDTYIVVNDSIITGTTGPTYSGFQLINADTISESNGVINYSRKYIIPGSFIDYFSGTTLGGGFIKVRDYFWSYAGGNTKIGNVLIFSVSDTITNGGNIVSVNTITMPYNTKFPIGRDAKNYWSSIFYDSVKNIVYYYDFGSQLLTLIEPNYDGSSGTTKNVINMTKYLNGYSDGSTFNLLVYFSFDPVDTNVLYCNFQSNTELNFATSKHDNTFVVDRDETKNGTLKFTKYLANFKSSGIRLVKDGYQFPSIMSLSADNGGILTVYNNKFSGYTTGNYIYSSMMRYKDGVPDVNSGNNGILNAPNQIDNYGTTATTVNTNLFEVTNRYGNKFSVPKILSGGCITTSVSKVLSINTAVSGSSYWSGTSITNPSPSNIIFFQTQFDPTVYNNSNISNFVISIKDNNDTSLIGNPSSGKTYTYNYINSNKGYIDDMLVLGSPISFNTGYKIHLDYYSGSSISPSNKITGYTYNGPTYTS